MLVWCFGEFIIRRPLLAATVPRSTEPPEITQNQIDAAVLAHYLDLHINPSACTQTYRVSGVYVQSPRNTKIHQQAISTEEDYGKAH